MARSTLGRPHAVLFPYPAQGHIKPMMQLAKILCGRGMYITFVNTEYTQERIRLSGSGKPSSVSASNMFRFETIPDNLPPEHGRTAKIAELSESLTSNGPRHFGKLLEKLKHLADVPPVTCIISDGVLSFTQKFAKEMGIPRIAFWTTSACGFLAYFSAPSLMANGYIPLKDESSFTKGSLEDVVTCIPGMSSVRVKDLPSFYVVTPSSVDYMFNYLVTEGQATLEADLVILNTFDDLEKSVVEALRTRLPVYTIGPLLLARSEIDGTEEENVFLSSMWTEETNCREWLDAQEPGSVVYVSFGSITVMSDQQLVEFAWGLEASKLPFLWAIRPDLVRGHSAVLPNEFLEKTENRSFFVKWAPQTEILSHPSVGGFLTHSGWNSTLESICAGVPMVSWPFFAEQAINRRFVSEVWRIGSEINDVVTREEVEKLVRNLMNGEEGKEMRRRVCELRDASKKAIGEGGSSHKCLSKLVEMAKGGDNQKFEVRIEDHCIEAVLHQ